MIFLIVSDLRVCNNRLAIQTLALSYIPDMSKRASKFWKFRILAPFSNSNVPLCPAIASTAIVQRNHAGLSAEYLVEGRFRGNGGGRVRAKQRRKARGRSEGPQGRHPRTRSRRGVTDPDDAIQRMYKVLPVGTRVRVLGNRRCPPEMVSACI